MDIVYYPSREDAEVIWVEFMPVHGAARSLSLLVDSGFTGRSSLILGEDAPDLHCAKVPPAQATGAIRGPQQRAWVTCRLTALNFQRSLIAVITDLAPLSLPADVQGLAGLTFLRQFARWGAEETAAGWRFFLSDDANG
jgi:hypothetical protein